MRAGGDILVHEHLVMAYLPKTSAGVVMCYVAGVVVGGLFDPSRALRAVVA